MSLFEHRSKTRNSNIIKALFATGFTPVSMYFTYSLETFVCVAGLVFPRMKASINKKYLKNSPSLLTEAVALFSFSLHRRKDVLA